MSGIITHVFTWAMLVKKDVKARGGIIDSEKKIIEEVITSSIINYIKNKDLYIYFDKFLENFNKQFIE